MNIELIASLEIDKVDENNLWKPPPQYGDPSGQRLPPVPRLRDLNLNEILSHEELQTLEKSRSRGRECRYARAGVEISKRSRMSFEDPYDSSKENIFHEDHKENVKYSDEFFEDEGGRGKEGHLEDKTDGSGDASSDDEKPLPASSAKLERDKRLAEGRKYAAEKRKALANHRHLEEQEKKQEEERRKSRLTELRSKSRKLARKPLPEQALKRLLQARAAKNEEDIFSRLEGLTPSEIIPVQAAVEVAVPSVTHLMKAKTAPSPSSAPIGLDSAKNKRKMSSKTLPSTRGMHALPSYQQFRNKQGGNVN